MTAFELVAKLVLDSSEYQSGLNSAEQEANGFESVFSGIAERLGSLLTTAGIVAAIQAIGQAFQQAVTDAAAYADQVDKGSRSLSMSNETYQVWQHALQQSGTDISAVSRGWLNLTDAIDKAKNQQEEWAADTSEVKSALDKLGIDPASFESVDALFDSIISSLAQMSSGAERDALTNALFGRGGRALNALLDSGVQGIEALKKEAYDLGLVMSDEDVAAGTAFGDAMANMNAAVEALKQNIVAGLFPLLTDAANMVTSIVAFLNGRTREKGIDEWFSDIDDSMRQAFSETQSNEMKVNGLITTLKSMSDETGKCSTNLKVWQGVAEELIRICPELKNQIDLVNGSFTEQTGSLEENAEAWFNNLRAQAASNALQAKADALATKAAEVVDKQIEANIKAAEAEGIRQEAIAKINEQIAKMGLSELEGYTPGEVSAMDIAQLYDLAQNVLPFWGIDQGMDAQLQQEIGELLAKGQTAANSAQEATNKVNELQAALDGATAEYQQYADGVNQYLQTIQQGIQNIPDKKVVEIHVVERRDVRGPDVRATPHAKGLNYVPYDGYIAELHRGEMVLNQASGRAYRQNNSDGFNMSQIGGMIADAVAAAVGDIQINMDGRRVGNAVTDYVSQNIYQRQMGRRYSTV